MACIENVSTCITQGNDWYLSLTVTEDGALNENGDPANPKDLTGATVTLDLKSEIDGTTVISPTVDSTDLPDGKVTFSLTAAQTETLISAGEISKTLTGSPKVVYSDGTADDLFILNAEIHESWA